jgi:hypothetical protein
VQMRAVRKAIATGRITTEADGTIIAADVSPAAFGSQALDGVIRVDGNTVQRLFRNLPHRT